MNEKNQIRLFRDPLDPRELSLSQQHEGLTLTSGTGNPRIPKNQFMKNENQILGGDRTRVLSANQVRCFEELLWDYLKRDSEHSDRKQTGWGTKTKVGLIACIERIIEEE